MKWQAHFTWDQVQRLAECSGSPLLSRHNLQYRLARSLMVEAKIPMIHCQPDHLEVFLGRKRYAPAGHPKVSMLPTCRISLRRLADYSAGTKPATQHPLTRG